MANIVEVLQFILFKVFKLDIVVLIDNDRIETDEIIEVLVTQTFNTKQRLVDIKSNLEANYLSKLLASDVLSIVKLMRIVRQSATNIKEILSFLRR